MDEPISHAPSTTLSGLETPYRPAALVPSQTIAGTALMLVVAIMTLLAALTIGAVSLVSDAVTSWQTDIGREVTVEVRPIANMKMDDQLKKVSALLEDFPGVGGSRALSTSETHRLLEPWLGAGFDMSALPVPRLVLVAISDPKAFQITEVAKALKDQIPGATLDDHAAWIDRLRAMAGTMQIAGAAVLALVLMALTLSVIFATRAAMAGNRHVIEVLHFVGAEDRYIAAQFQSHFLILGVKGGLAGGLTAAVVFLSLAIATRETTGLPGTDQLDAFLGSLAPGWTAYAFVSLLILAVAALTSITSRLAVQDYLRHVE